MRTVTSDGHKGVSLTYTCRQKNQDYTVVQCIFGGDYDYNITYSAVKGGTDFIEDARKSFQSFRALSPEREPSKLMGRLNGRVYTAKDGAYKMTLPKGWKLSKETKNLLLFTSKDGRVNINLQTSKSDPRLLQYKKAYFTEYFRSTLGESAKVTSFRKTSVSGKTARYLECTYTRYGQPLRAKQYLFNDGETGYVLTFTAPAAMKKVANFGEVARSFEILEQ